MMRPKKADGDSYISDTPDAQGNYHAFVSMGVGTDGENDRRYRVSKDLNTLPAVLAEAQARLVVKTAIGRPSARR